MQPESYDNVSVSGWFVFVVVSYIVKRVIQASLLEQIRRPVAFGL